MTQPSNPPIECCGVRWMNGALCEIDSGRVMVTVQFEPIRRIVLRHGVQALHPIRQSIVGVILLAAGFFPLMHLIHWFRHGGVFIDMEAWLLPVPVAGGWALFSALKRGVYLEVEQKDGARKRLAFLCDPGPEAMNQFLASIERACGIEAAREDLKGWG